MRYEHTTKGTKIETLGGTFVCEWDGESRRYIWDELYDTVEIHMYPTNINVFLGSENGKLEDVRICIDTDGVDVGDGEDQFTVEELLESDYEMYIEEYCVTEEVKAKILKELSFYYNNYKSH